MCAQVKEPRIGPFLGYCFVRTLPSFHRLRKGILLVAVSPQRLKPAMKQATYHSAKALRHPKSGATPNQGQHRFFPAAFSVLSCEGQG